MHLRLPKAVSEEPTRRRASDPSGSSKAKATEESWLSLSESGFRSHEGNCLIVRFLYSGLAVVSSRLSMAGWWAGELGVLPV